jgi:hypothetical protein
MIALVLLASWMLVIALVVGLCAAARRGDHAEAQREHVAPGRPSAARGGPGGAIEPRSPTRRPAGAEGREERVAA